MKLRQFFKTMTILSWGFWLIDLCLYIIRYTVSGIGKIAFSWGYPMIWLFLAGCIFCILAIFWPKKKN